MAHFVFNPADLAPGDAKSADFDAAGFEVSRILSRDDPLFEQAYQPLWEQFGAAHEIESREVLGRRLAWDPAQPRDGFAMQYDLLLVRDREGNFAAVRDHAAIADASGVVVHLSHALVAPAWRRSGLAGWLRATPLQTARACLAGAGLPASTPITLAAEMEYLDAADESRLIRLRAYERAGFRKIDPRSVDYHQPDFRPPSEIDASGGAQPLRFQLLVRRVGREDEDVISGSEICGIVERFYTMYAQEFRAVEMDAVWPKVALLPAAEEQVALLPPTAV